MQNSPLPQQIYVEPDMNLVTAIQHKKVHKSISHSNWYGGNLVRTRNLMTQMGLFGDYY